MINFLAECNGEIDEMLQIEIFDVYLSRRKIQEYTNEGTQVPSFYNP